MLMRPGPNTRKFTQIVPVLALVLFGITAHGVFAQNVAQSTSGDVSISTSDLAKTTAESSAGNKKPETTEEKLNTLEQMLERQSQRLNQLQETIAQQQETIRLLASKLNLGEPSTPSSSVDASVQAKQAPSPAIEDRLKKI